MNKDKVIMYIDCLKCGEEEGVRFDFTHNSECSFINRACKKCNTIHQIGYTLTIDDIQTLGGNQ